MSWVYRPLVRPVYEASDATVSEASEAVVRPRTLATWALEM